MIPVSTVLAEAERLATAIERQPHGWRTYVTVQDMPPNVPTYTWANAGAVDHCGLSVNAVYAAAGLVMGRDFGNNAWTPSGYEWMRQRGRLVPIEQVQPGDSVYIRWSPTGFPVHHIELATGTYAGGVPTMGWNVDTTGQGRRFVRPDSVIVGVGRPFGLDYTDAPDLTPAVIIPAIVQQLMQQEEAMPIILDLTDGEGGPVVDHVCHLPTLGWHRPKPGTNIDAGWHRAKMPQADFEAWNLEQLANVNTITDAVVARAIAALKA